MRKCEQLVKRGLSENGTNWWSWGGSRNGIGVTQLADSSPCVGVFVGGTVLDGFDIDGMQPCDQIVLTCRNECEVEFFEHRSMPRRMNVQHVTNGRIQERKSDKEARAGPEQVKKEIEIVIVVVQFVVVAGVNNHRFWIFGVSMDSCNEIVAALRGAPQVASFDGGDPPAEHFAVSVVEAVVVICGNDGAERETDQGVQLVDVICFTSEWLGKCFPTLARGNHMSGLEYAGGPWMLALFEAAAH